MEKRQPRRSFFVIKDQESVKKAIDMVAIFDV